MDDDSLSQRGAGGSLCRLVGWLVGWLVDWLVGWLVGWLVTTSASQPLCRCPAWWIGAPFFIQVPHVYTDAHTRPLSSFVGLLGAMAPLGPSLLVVHDD